MTAILQTMREGGLQHPQEIMNFFASAMISVSGVVAKALGGFLVSQQTVPDMTVKVAKGKAYIKTSDGAMAYPIWLHTDDANVTIAPNSSGNSRIDALIAYVDVGVAPTDEVDNVVQLYVVQGTPAGSPVAPLDAAIAAEIGSSNPFIRLANITVASGAVSIVTANISDQRTEAVQVVEGAIQTGSSLYGADAGSTDAYAITVAPVPTSYTAGMTYRFKANTTNTGACSLNVNGLGAIAIKKNASVDLEDGDIKAGQVVVVTYDGTYFQLVSTTADEGITTVADGATITLDSSLSKNFRVVLGAAGRTLAISNMKNGRPIYLETEQDGTGGRTITTWPSIDSTFSEANVDVANNVITVGKNIKTGTPIVFSSTTTVPAGLVAGTVYYAINNNSTSIKVASSLANAQAGTAIDITDDGTGTHTIKCQIRWNGGSAPSFTAGKYLIDSFLFIPIDVANGDIRGYATGDTI